MAFASSAKSAVAGLDGSSQPRGNPHPSRLTGEISRPPSPPRFGLSSFLHLSYLDSGYGKVMSFDDLFRQNRFNPRFSEPPTGHKNQPSMKNTKTKKALSPGQREELLSVLRARFEKNINRHEGLEWAQVIAKLEANAEKLWALNEMEKTGGEPDVVGHDKKTDEYIFFDCSPQSPEGRTSICYDREALDSRKEHKPRSSAMDLAAGMGLELLTEEQYHALQKLGNFDTKSSSWLKAPADIRKLGGAIFGDRRFGRVFVYHNGAESYYSGRGFRGSLRV